MRYDVLSDYQSFIMPKHSTELQKKTVHGDIAIQ